MDTITCKLPQCHIATDFLQLPCPVTLADPMFNIPAPIDILLGADVFFLLTLPGTLMLSPQYPVLQNTQFGYIVAGCVPSESVETDNRKNHLVTLHSLSNTIDEYLPRFWDLDKVPQNSCESKEDKYCESLFKTTTQFSNKRYTVNLPFKVPHPLSEIGNSYSIALKTFLSLESKMVKNPEFQKTYSTFINEYLALGHAEIIPFDGNSFKSANSGGYFMPHHAVIRNDKLTTKLRVVFNGSSRTTNGKSLNCILNPDPPIQEELFDVLFRFRYFKFVFTCDIQKMYRKILVNNADHKFQRILWREHPGDPLQCIQLKTVTYGINCSPYLACRCLKDLADSHSTQFPLGSQAILNGKYIDDFLYGCDTVVGLHKVKEELVTVLQKGGFSLHKWFSNDHKFCTTAPEKQNSVDLFDDETYKILGIEWKYNTDELTLTNPHEDNLPITKRSVLSFIAKFYDPLGLANPITTYAKIFMQKLWSSKLDWDQNLPPNLSKSWLKFKSDLIHMPKLTVPRWISISPHLQECFLYGFADASQKAYGGCIYLKVINSDNSISTFLLCAKSRVAPLKSVTIPRLELCAALLLSRLMNKIRPLFSCNIKQVFLFSDSSITLSWISSESLRWCTFVANRVAEVQRLTSDDQWHYVPTDQNPSDLVSRGVEPHMLAQSDLWWKGPNFIRSHPQAKYLAPSVLEADLLKEQRKSIVTHISIFKPEIEFSRFSSFPKLLRTVAYCLRFIHNCKRGSQKEGHLTTEELKLAHTCILKLVQSEAFPSEIAHLKNCGSIKDKRIQSLYPFYDGNGLLRVGGRLQNAPVSFDQKHPIILPQNHHVTRLLIKHKHEVYMHAGAQLTLSNLRLRYWPINGKREVKGVLSHCLPCSKLRAKAATQLMGSLPLERISSPRVFQYVGVDFAGPLMVKQSRLRKILTTKAYICLFICMTTKAVHIELVSSMSTDAFLAALQRFIGRRSRPSTIFCDNGTNFVGAKNKLFEYQSFLSKVTRQGSLHNFCNQHKIQFKFSPPYSPETGGLWESNIKNVKYHLNRVLGKSQLTFEEMSTVLVSIEAMLNSRPLCPMSSDPLDLNYLTSGHFLVGTSLQSYPEADHTFTPINRLSFWKQCSQLSQSFWKHWSLQYLHTLQNRPKNSIRIPNLNTGELVLIKDPNLPPLSWSIGRIVELLPGKDGAVRVVKIKTADGEFVRPLTRVCPLPIQTADSSISRARPQDVRAAHKEPVVTPLE